MPRSLCFHAADVNLGDEKEANMIFQAIQVALLAMLIVVPAAATAGRQDGPSTKRADGWRALHLLGYNTDKDLELLGGHVPKLANLGLNVLILEIDYNFNFQSHPELRLGKAPISREG